VNLSEKIKNVEKQNRELEQKFAASLEKSNKVIESTSSSSKTNSSYPKSNPSNLPKEKEVEVLIGCWRTSSAKDTFSSFEASLEKKINNESETYITQFRQIFQGLPKANVLSVSALDSIPATAAMIIVCFFTPSVRLDLDVPNKFILDELMKRHKKVLSVVFRMGNRSQQAEVTLNDQNYGESISIQFEGDNWSQTDINQLSLDKLMKLLKSR